MPGTGTVDEAKHVSVIERGGFQKSPVFDVWKDILIGQNTDLQ